jgi:hypothetical protein
VLESRNDYQPKNEYLREEENRMGRLNVFQRIVRASESGQPMQLTAADVRNLSGVWEISEAAEDADHLQETGRPRCEEGRECEAPELCNEHRRCFRK